MSRVVSFTLSGCGTETRQPSQKTTLSPPLLERRAREAVRWVCAGHKGVVFAVAGSECCWWCSPARVGHAIETRNKTVAKQQNYCKTTKLLFRHGNATSSTSCSSSSGASLLSRLVPVSTWWPAGAGAGACVRVYPPSPAMADRADAAGSDPSGRPAATLQEEEGKQRARRVAPLPLLDAVVPAKPHRAGGWCPSPSVCPPSMSQQAITWSTNTLRPNVRPGQAVSKLGFRFVWTAHHRVGADLEPFRRVGDELADAVLDAVSIPPKTDSLEVIRAAAADSMHPAHAPAQALLEQTTRDPVWLDRAQLARGQEVLIRYGVGSLSMLFYFSLVGGFGAPQINKGACVHCVRCCVMPYYVSGCLVPRG